MSYIERLRETAENSGNILCFGIDPVLEQIPLKGNPDDVISKFFLDILSAMKNESINIPSIKPNIAFFEQYGFDGLKALKTIINEYKRTGIDVILDAKRGDIGKTASAYASSVFSFWNADAVTVHPYLGIDSISPFLEHNGKGVYALCRTSNKSAGEMQNLVVGSEPLYKKTAELILKWHKPGLGAVVGATYLKELEHLSDFFAKSGKEVPLLIPGVGAQGGSAEDVMDVLKKTDTPLWLHRVNSSSGISYAYEKADSDDYAGCAVKEMKKLSKLLSL